MKDIETYVSLLKEKLPMHKTIKIPTLSEEDARKILARLIAEGYKVELEDTNTFKLVGIKKSQRVTLRIDEHTATKLIEIYKEPNLSKAIRLAISDALRIRGIDVDLTKRERKNSRLPTVDEVFVVDSEVS